MELYKLTCRVFNKDNKLIGYDAVDKIISHLYYL